MRRVSYGGTTERTTPHDRLSSRSQLRCVSIPIACKPCVGAEAEKARSRNIRRRGSQKRATKRGSNSLPVEAPSRKARALAVSRTRQAYSIWRTAIAVMCIDRRRRAFPVVAILVVWPIFFFLRGRRVQHRWGRRDAGRSFNQPRLSIKK